MFADNVGLTAANLSRVQFDGFLPGAAVIAPGGSFTGYEIVPVPEPTTVGLATVAGLAGVGLARRRRATPTMGQVA